MTLRAHGASWLTALLMAALPVTGCVAAADGSSDGAVDDAADDGIICPPSLPPPSDPCLPVCGNEFGVGQPCTKDGFECPAIDVGNEATFCTVDFEDTGLAFCTKPCFDDSDCGSDAFCTGDPANPDSDKGCTPAACQ
jgi:hypothetical protein